MEKGKQNIETSNNTLHISALLQTENEIHNDTFVTRSTGENNIDKLKAEQVVINRERRGPVTKERKREPSTIGVQILTNASQQLDKRPPLGYWTLLLLIRQRNWDARREQALQ